MSNRLVLRVELTRSMEIEGDGDEEDIEAYIREKTKQMVEEIQKQGMDHDDLRMSGFVE